MTFTRVKKKFENRGNVEKRNKYKQNKTKIAIKNYDRKKMYKINTINPAEFLGEIVLTPYQTSIFLDELFKKYEFYQTCN